MTAASIGKRPGDVVERAVRAVRDADADLTASTALREGVAALGARGGILVFLNDDGETLEVLASVGYPGELVHPWRRFSLDLDVPLARVVRTGAPEFGPLAAETEVDGRPRSGDGATACVPLVVDGRTLGALGFTAAAGWMPDDEAKSLLGELAELSARAVVRARAAQRHERLSNMQAVLASLSTASTPRTVAAVILEHGLTGARAGAVGLLREDGEELEIIAATGPDGDLASVGDRLKIEATLPLTVAAREHREVFLESAEALAEQYPELAQLSDWQDTSLAALPLLIGDSCVGAIRVTLAAPRLFDEDERAFMRALAQLCAGALDRAIRLRRYERLAQLQALAAAVAGASTPEDVANAIVSVAVDVFGAASGVVAVTVDDQSMRVVATRGLSADLVDTTALGRAVLGGAPLLLGTRAEARASDPWFGEQLARFGGNAVAAAPLRAEGAIVGALLLEFADERAFDGEDASFLFALADLCAQALERARLYAAVEESRSRLERLLEQLQEGVLTVDGELRVQFANAEAERLLGTDLSPGTALPDPWPGVSLRDFAAPLVKPAPTPTVSTVDIDASNTYELVGIPAAGTPILLVRDISERERRQRADREFIANAAHELRTPIAAIRSALEALELGAKHEDWIRDHLIAGIATEVERVGTLVRALLVLAHAQADPAWLPLAPVDVEPILNEIATAIDVHPGVRVVCTCSPGARALAEPTLLATAIANVARNAAKHTERGSITLSCSGAPAGRLTVVIRDTGPGIPSEAKGHVFDRFYRADETTGDGFGLGLAIVRQMTNVLGGTIEIDSKPHGGTTVKLTFMAA